MSEDQGTIVASREGGAGIVRLNRPRALNALDLGMVRAMRSALRDFLADPAVALVILEAEGERAFCAGGDIRAVAASGRARDGIAEAFWREEYELIAHLARAPKPVVALADGIVMGGGAGLVMHLRHRVATERVRFAMPEVGIGFLPDVGATYRLPRLGGAFGCYLGLTGETVEAGDALAAGLFDRCVPSDRTAALRAALVAVEPGADGAAVDEVIAAYAAPLGAPLQERHGEAIAAAFGREDPCAIEAALSAMTDDANHGDFAARTLAAMRARSPWSMGLTNALLKAGADSGTLEECLVREFRAACHCLRVADFHEGVRAAVIDKDRNPIWPSREADWRAPPLSDVLAEHPGRPDPVFGG
ncbi:enoyl-CoA hydratase/isomerase family protein [Aureimonas flava]|uniref:3-hydroxyisobutyryl-CoA hydrolase n=1 Tax=Aureimonas flava TaxID=2320271 RepID=A0A3A1WW50_9HYPH|nr:enoyl-CoA hydratase/isomerase family protein [Aureimonas flava]RIY03242.1 enoyl-CoA hydratase/isomerase family protein [Aureimonas flava]